jgi:antitoxin ParD1/3/4
MQTITKTIHVSLPESLIESAKTQAEKGQFSNMSEYVRSLIREDVVRREEQKLQELLLEGVRSEPGPQIGSEEWQTFRKRLSEEARKGQAK